MSSYNILIMALDCQTASLKEETKDGFLKQLTSSSSAAT